jgi:hypothetical protein
MHRNRPSPRALAIPAESINPPHVKRPARGAGRVGPGAIRTALALGPKCDWVLGVSDEARGFGRYPETEAPDGFGSHERLRAPAADLKAGVARQRRRNLAQISEQDLRKALYKALIAGGVSTVVDDAQRIVAVLRRAKP